MATITFTTRIGGVAANVTGVVLVDPADTPTYGLRRADTGQVIKAANTPLANTSAGVYSIAFAAVTGVTYEGYIAWTYAGETHHHEVVYTEPLPDVTTTISLANAIQARFKAEVATPRSLPTLYDNDPTPAPTNAATWCRFTVKDGDSQRITVGVRQYRTVGVAIAQLFGRIGNGTKALRELADAIVTVFQDQAAAGVRYGVPHIDNIGDDKHGHYQLNVYCPFQADTIES